MLTLFALGAGMTVFAIIYYTIEMSVQKIQKTLFMEQIKPDFKDRRTLLYMGAFVGILLGIYFTAGTSNIFLGTIVCAVIGAGAVRFTFYALDKRKEEKKRQECYLLFTTTELFLQSGLSIPQSLVTPVNLRLHWQTILIRPLPRGQQEWSRRWEYSRNHLTYPKENN